MGGRTCAPQPPAPALTAASLFRQIPQAAASMKEGKWDRKKVGDGHSTPGGMAWWVSVWALLAHLCFLP